MEQLKHRPIEAAGLLPEAEVVGPLQEEVAFLGEKQVEACQVDALLVELDLGEVGVVGQIGGQVRGELDLEIVDAELLVDAAASQASKTRSRGPRIAQRARCSASGGGV